MWIIQLKNIKLKNDFSEYQNLFFFNKKLKSFHLICHFFYIFKSKLRNKEFSLKLKLATKILFMLSADSLSQKKHKFSIYLRIPGIIHPKPPTATLTTS